MPNKYMPINIRLGERRCLVVGGGNVALRKLDTLLDYGADITVISPRVAKKIAYYAKEKRVQLQEKSYQSPEASAYGLVIAATDDSQVNRQVYEDCRQAGVLVNVADKPSLCDFTFPAVVKRDVLTIAIAADGKAPFLCGYLRVLLEDIFPKHWTKIARLAVAFRTKVQKRWQNDMQRKTTSYQQFLQADWKTLLKQKNEQELDDELEQLIELQPPLAQREETEDE